MDLHNWIIKTYPPSPIREPLQTQTIQPKKYFKWINELQADNGHMLPTLTNYKFISSYIDMYVKKRQSNIDKNSIKCW